MPSNPYDLPTSPTTPDATPVPAENAAQAFPAAADARTVAPPLSGPPPTSHAPTPAGPAYDSARGRGRVAIAFLSIIIVLEVISGLIQFPLMQPFLDEARGGAPITDDQLITLGVTALGFALLYFAVFVTTVVTFCMWVHRAHRNLSSLGTTGTSFTPGWAVGWYFVPIMNLFRPYQAMSELWRATAVPSNAWKQAAVPAVIAVWWGAYLFAGLAGRISMRLGAQDAYEAMYASAATGVAGAGLSIVSACCCIAVIRRVVDLQDRRFAAASPVATGARMAA